jgi:hypothetical protein
LKKTPAMNISGSSKGTGANWFSDHARSPDHGDHPIPRLC